MDYYFGSSHYHISVENPAGICHGVQQVWLDGNVLPGNMVALVKDGKKHELRVLMG